MPITAGLKSLNGQWISAYHLLSAGSIMAAIPPVIMFFLMQKHFIAGLTLGASKGYYDKNCIYWGRQHCFYEKYFN